jgi:Asp-tRNA(Asn)/Glu-tRNA(Gln) amidotransferase A subunit family amidase
MPNKAQPQLTDLTATQIAQRIAQGETTSEAVVSACLARILERDSAVRAWASIDAARVLVQAREADAAAPSGRGLLHGVPFGVKDIIETVDLPTGYGSPIWTGNRTTIDAPSVALPRAAGAIVLGKTVTSEFASLAPTVTRNPHDPTRIPAPSSAGSAAAVADRQVPIALGTQTGGSILRPASFCGCIGFKPTYATINSAGVKPAIPSVDTLGLLSRSIDDCELFMAVLTSQPPRVGEKLVSAPVVGVSRTHLWDKAEPATKAAIEDAAARLAKAGAKVKDVALPADFAGLHHVRLALNNVDRALAYSHEWRTAREGISAGMREVMEAGFKTPRKDYVDALVYMERCRAQLGALFDGIDVLLVPCVAGEAIPSSSPIADPGFQELWTLMHTPAISLPTHMGPIGLPVGIQLVGPRWQDDRLLATSRWALEKLGTA